MTTPNTPSASERMLTIYRFCDETLSMNQDSIAEVFGVSRQSLYSMKMSQFKKAKIMQYEHAVKYLMAIKQQVDDFLEGEL